MKCSRCGQDNTLDQSICIRCGAPIQRALSESKPQSHSHDPEKDASQSNSGSATPKTKNNSAQAQRIDGEESAPKKSDSKGGLWVFILVIALGLLFAISIEEPPHGGYSNSTVSGTKSPPPKDNGKPTQLSKDVNFTASKPSVGDDLILGRQEILYCLEWDFRLTRISELIDATSESEISYFNSRVADYNERCSSYRYYDSAMNSARSQFTNNKEILASEVAEILRTMRVELAGKLETQRTRPKPSRKVETVQRLLNGLGYDAGPADGLFGRRTESAIIKFQRDFDFEADGIVDQMLLDQLNDMVVLSSMGEGDAAVRSATIATTRGVSSSDKRAIENACEGKKLAFGPARYNQCVQDMIRELELSPSNISFSGVSASDKRAIESACEGKKLAFGPARYNQCVQDMIRDSRGY